MNIPTWVWIASVGVTVLFLVFDVIHMARNPHAPTMKECLRHLAFFVGSAIVFGRAGSVTAFSVSITSK